MSMEQERCILSSRYLLEVWLIVHGWFLMVVIELSVRWNVILVEFSFSCAVGEGLAVPQHKGYKQGCTRDVTD